MEKTTTQVKKKLNIAFDIDDTLYKVVETPRSDKLGNRYKQVPDYELIHVLQWFHSQGHTLFVWSAGGCDYAQTIVDKLGLEEIVTVIPKRGWDNGSEHIKIDIAFDDEDVSLGLVNVIIER